MSLYLEYFGLEREPCGFTPEPEFYFAIQPHTMAWEWMHCAIAHQWPAWDIREFVRGRPLLPKILTDSITESLGWT